MTKTLTVKDLPVTERPRERLARGEHVAAHELIAVLIGRGVVGADVMEVAKQLLKTFGSLEGVVNASLENLMTVRGLGPAKALQLKACLEIARRVIADEALVEKERNNSKGIAAPEDIARLVKPLIKDWQKEHFFTVSFDTRHRVMGVDLTGIGTLSANLVHPREVFGSAIARHAASIAVSHNHPSGDPQPSEADLEVTKQLAEASKIMGIVLLDHIIISKTHLYSLRENNLLN